MADAPVVHIGQNSPEFVAWRLFDRISGHESAGGETTERTYILDTYAECLWAVLHPRDRLK